MAGKTEESKDKVEAADLPPLTNTGDDGDGDSDGDNADDDGVDDEEDGVGDVGDDNYDPSQDSLMVILIFYHIPKDCFTFKAFVLLSRWRHRY